MLTALKRLPRTTGLEFISKVFRKQRTLFNTESITNSGERPPIFVFFGKSFEKKIYFSVMEFSTFPRYCRIFSMILETIINCNIIFNLLYSCFHIFSSILTNLFLNSVFFLLHYLKTKTETCSNFPEKLKKKLIVPWNSHH